MPLPRAVRARTEPVLAVVVCHDGQLWLREVLSALRRLSPRPRHILAVDTGSRDRTAELLAEAASGAQPLLDGVLALDRDTGFGTAVAAAVSAAVTRWGDPGGWIWLLHDDSAPEPDCLGLLLRTAELSTSAGLLGPLALDWADPRLVIEVGLSTDASGHRQTGVGPTELDWSRVRDSEPGTREMFEQSTEVLAVSSAGALIRRDVWDAVGGYDETLPLLRDDVDFGWRVNRAGGLALCVPAARLRHARAVTKGLRPPDALHGKSVRSADRAHGLRTFLVNCATLGFLVGVPRVVLLCLLRAIGFTLLRRFADARAELGALGYLLGGRASLFAARRARTGDGTVRGLLTSRTTRLRNAFRGGLASWVRRRAAADAALGRLSPTRRTWLAPDDVPEHRPIGPDALPAGALGRRGTASRRTAGLRRPAMAVAVPVAEPLPRGRRPTPRPRPSPVPRDGSVRQELMLVDVGRGRVLAQVLLAPPVLLLAGLALVSLVTNAGRLGLHLTGGGLLPAQGLAATWSDYLASWHAVAGGTAAPAPATLAVVGALGAVLGGPPVAVAVLLFGDAPLAGVLAYAATRRLPVRRWVRALVAAGYALLPFASTAVAQGRLNVVVVHLLLPPVLAGVVAVLTPSPRGWLSSAAGTAIGLAVIGAFDPLVHATVIVVALVGFVAVPGVPGGGRRRAAALFAVVLLPLALLVPWPAVVLTDPSVLLTGVGGRAPGVPLTVAQVVGGGIAVVATLVAVVLRPRRVVVPGLAVAVLGAAAALVVDRAGDWPGASLMVAGAGLGWAMLGACRRDAEAGGAVRVLAALGATAVLALAVAGLFSSGPLCPAAPVLAAPLAKELTGTGRSVLVLAADGQPTRQAGARLPAFGDDDMAPVPAAPARLARWTRDLRSGDRTRTRSAVAQAATSGVLFLVLPDRATAARFASAAGDLASPVPATSDGRPVQRLQPAGGTATLISPALARQAVTGGKPPTVLGAQGISPVDAIPPDVAVRVSDGPLGRLLVLSADDENGWQATIDGRAAPIVRAWGHLVAVTVPTDASDVAVYVPATLRDALLLVQTAVLLFAAVAAIPGRR
ncbi:MAG TPA: glycosyltransferase [Pseudonocardiaceae bacterium]|nr:glycosyltransferase [Pseudonocardiaceae bacterium]